MTWSTPMCLTKAHLAAPPADPTTVCPLSLAIWHTTDPTAPEAADTNTTSPGLGIAIFSKPTQAVSPGMPATPRNAWGGSPNVSSFCRLAAGALNRSRQPNQEETRSPGLNRGSSDAATSPIAPPCSASDLEARAPAVHGRVGRGDLPDRACGHLLARPRRRRVNRTIGHAATHIRIHCHPQVLHLNFARPRVGHRHRDELEIIGTGHADKSGFQMDFTRRDHGREPVPTRASAPITAS